MSELYLEYYARSIGILSKLVYIIQTKTVGMHKMDKKRKDYGEMRNVYMNKNDEYMHILGAYCGNFRNVVYII